MYPFWSVGYFIGTFGISLMVLLWVAITQKQIFQVIIEFRKQFPPTKPPDYDACIKECIEEINVISNPADWQCLFKSS